MNKKISYLAMKMLCVLIRNLSGFMRLVRKVFWGDICILGKVFFRRKYRRENGYLLFRLVWWYIKGRIMFVVFWFVFNILDVCWSSYWSNWKAKSYEPIHSRYDY